MDDLHQPSCVSHTLHRGWTVQAHDSRQRGGRATMKATEGVPELAACRAIAKDKRERAHRQMRTRMAELCVEPYVCALGPLFWRAGLFGVAVASPTSCVGETMHASGLRSPDRCRRSLARAAAGAGAK